MQGRHFKGRKYGILKFGRFWRIGVCIVDNDILHPVALSQFWGSQCSTTYTKQCVHKETYTADLTDHSPAVKKV